VFGASRLRAIASQLGMQLALRWVVQQDFFSIRSDVEQLQRAVVGIAPAITIASAPEHHI
jgi:hypothetical protein